MNDMLNGKRIEDLAPHTQRVFKEWEDLSTKAHALSTFIRTNPVFETLDEAERIDLVEQRVAMFTYIAILERRINRATSQA